MRRLLDGKDIKKGSIPKGDLKKAVQNALAIRVTGDLPTNGFNRHGTVSNSPDGVEFGPYADGGAASGSICTSSMNGQPFSDVEHLAFEARYTADNNTGGVGVPYLRVFLENNATTRSSRRIPSRPTLIPRKVRSTRGSRPRGHGGTTTTPVPVRIRRSPPSERSRQRDDQQDLHLARKHGGNNLSALLAHGR